MFDEMSGEGCSGIGFWVRVTAETGSDLEGISLESLDAPDGVDVNSGDTLQFSLMRIDQWSHAE